MSDEIGDERVGARRRKMLGDFQTLDDVKAAFKIERRRKVADDETLRIDLKPVAIYIVAVNADDVMDPLRPPLPQPRSACAADVEDALHGEYRPNRRHYATGGIGRSGRRHIL